MSVRSRIAERPASVEVAKVFGPGVPESFRQGEIASQMTPASPFSPGTPTGPYDGYDRTPRSKDFGTGYNIATRPRTHERVSFDALTGLIEAYDVAQICIWHRIDSIRSLDWKLIAADGYDGDVTDAIKVGMYALEEPDRETAFDGWLAKYLYDVLAYDAGTLARMRNRGGRCVGLSVVDGTTIAPLLDYWGNSPKDPAEAYVQYAQGLPWNWLTRADLIYEPFRPTAKSPYGKAPIEAILLNANTDLRFQVYFLQRFTEGNLPAAFASAPESWSPDQIEQFQALWDAAMYGDQSGKHQVKWMPPGSKFVWSNEKDFSDVFSLFMMRKTTAAYHVVPSDLGFTEDVNRSSGESQADVQHRVGDLPLIRRVQRILTRFLQKDLGLPLKHAFDLGEEQDDQLNQAQSDDIYIKNGTITSDDTREMRFGLPRSVRPVPRVFFTERAGPIPLDSLLALSGDIDPQTGAPEPDAPLPHTVFAEAPGVLPNPPLYSEPLAEETYGPKAIPAGTETQSTQAVAKEGEAAAGITAETGIFGYDLDREDEDDDQPTAVAKAELAAFQRFRKARIRGGAWRDFDFRTVDPIRAHNLNDVGRLAVRKASGEIAVAGLAVQAADTGRVLMLQRSLDPEDPAAGTWEMPGGHIEGDESPLSAAWREWSEETGCVPAPGVQTGSWTSANGIYQGFVWTIDSESMVPVRSDTAISNPDDPDGDQAEAIAWWNPADLPGNSAVRPELLADIGAVTAALGCAPDPCCGADCCQGDSGCCGGSGGCQCGPAVAEGAVAKAADARPKGRRWPGWDLDLKAVEHWAPLLAAALSSALSKTQAEQIAAAYIASDLAAAQESKGKREAVEAAAAWLAGQLDLTSAIAPLIPGILADGYLIGAASAAAMTGDTDVDLGGWEPGDTDTAQQRTAVLGLDAPSGQDDATAAAAGGYMTRLGRALVEGVTSGLGAAAVGAGLGAVLADGAQAAGEVLGQIVIAIGQAAMAVYQSLAAQQQLNFLTASDGRVCVICDDLEADNPYTASNVPSVPQHPRCRCAIVPA